MASPMKLTKGSGSGVRMTTTLSLASTPSSAVDVDALAPFCRETPLPPLPAITAEYVSTISALRGGKVPAGGNEGLVSPTNANVDGADAQLAPWRRGSGMLQPGVATRVELTT